jgi:hypothetical protein
MRIMGSPKTYVPSSPSLIPSPPPKMREAAMASTREGFSMRRVGEPANQFSPRARMGRCQRRLGLWEECSVRTPYTHPYY